MIDVHMKKLVRISLLVLLLCCIGYVWYSNRDAEHRYHPRDYAEIAREGVLRATMEYNAIDFHAVADSVGGFYYEMLQAFARDHQLKADIVPLMSMPERIEGINSGRFDVVAHGIPSTSELKDTLLLSMPIITSRLILVQRIPQNAEDSAKYVTSQIQLAGKTLHTVNSPSVQMRLEHLGAEIGDTIYLEEEERYGNEQLISMVAHGDIDYAVCEENIAAAAVDSLPQLDIHLPIGFTQFYCWGMNKLSPALRDSVNIWLESYLKTKEFRALKKKFF